MPSQNVHNLADRVRTWFGHDFCQDKTGVQKEKENGNGRLSEEVSENRFFCEGHKKGNVCLN